MVARLRAIIAGSRKALLIYTLWLVLVGLQFVSAAGSLIRCANNPACSWPDFIAIAQKAIENVSMITAAAGALLPSLMAFEDAFAKFGLPPGASLVVAPASATLEATKESARMSIVQKNVPVSAPVYDLMKKVEELAADVLQKKPASELQGDVLDLLSMFTSLAEIPKDFASDPEAVQNAVYLAADDLVKRLYTILRKDGAPTPGS